MWVKEEKTSDLTKAILQEYSSIIIERGDGSFEIEDMRDMLEMLDTSTRGDILADLKAYKKTVV